MWVGRLGSGPSSQKGRRFWGHKAGVPKGQMEEGRDGVHFEGTDMSHLSTAGRLFELFVLGVSTS